MKDLRIITLTLLAICLLFPMNALAEPWHLSMRARGNGKYVDGNEIVQVSGIVIGKDNDDQPPSPFIAWPAAPLMPNYSAVIRISDPNTEAYYNDDLRLEVSDREDWNLKVTVGAQTPDEGDPNAGSVADASHPNFFPLLKWDSNQIAPNQFMQLRLGEVIGPLLVSNMKTTNTYQTTEADTLATGYYDPTNDRASMRYKVTAWASEVETQSIDMIPGWNWVSFYVLPDDTSLDSFFVDHTDLIDQVSTQTRSAKYRNGIWRGDDLNLMSNISKGVTFKIKAITGFTLSVTGRRLPQDMPIDLYQNWTWIAYLPDSSLPLEDVVSSIFDDFKMITSQTQSNLKKPDGRLPGDLKNMEQGKGYCVKMLSPGFLIYP